MDLHQKFTLVAHNFTPLVIQNTHQHYAVASVCMCVCISLYLCVCVCVIFVLSYLSSPAFFPIFHVCCPFSHPYTAPAIRQLLLCPFYTTTLISSIFPPAASIALFSTPAMARAEPSPPHTSAPVNGVLAPLCTKVRGLIDC